MQKLIFFIAATFTLASLSFAPAKKDKVQWLTVAEFQEAYAKDPRPVLVDIYTHWCGWCKVMDKETYSNNKVADYINDHYYAVRLDAETKDSITWGDKKFGFNSAYKVNDLAMYLSYGQMSFPTTVFLTDINAQPAPLAGFLKPSELEPPLKYFGDGFYKSQNFSDFQKKFTTTW
jgi:uncharacterized protein YyaL (SSP411 family)